MSFQRPEKPLNKGSITPTDNIARPSAKGEEWKEGLAADVANLSFKFERHPSAWRDARDQMLSIIAKHAPDVSELKDEKENHRLEMGYKKAAIDNLQSRITRLEEALRKVEDIGLRYGIREDIRIHNMIEASRAALSASPEPPQGQENQIRVSARLLQDLLEDLVDLRGEWNWRKDEVRCGYQKAYIELEGRIAILSALLAPQGQMIEVCDKCFRASCFQGMFMCDDYQTAGTVKKSIVELQQLKLEDSQYWGAPQGKGGEGV